MSTDKNPYTPSEFGGGNLKSAGAYSGANDAVVAAMPLHRAKFWLKLLGIFNVVIGALYCVTIIGAIVGWLPLWIGILLNKAASNLETGVRNNSSGAIQNALSNLATVITFAGVLCLIQLVIFVLYILVFVIMAVAVGIGAASNVGGS